MPRRKMSHRGLANIRAGVRKRMEKQNGNGNLTLPAETMQALKDAISEATERRTKEIITYIRQHA